MSSVVKNRLNIAADIFPKTPFLTDESHRPIAVVLLTEISVL